MVKSLFLLVFLAKTRLIQTNIDCTSTIGKIFKRTLNNLMKISLLDLSYVNTLVVVEVQYLQQTNILQIPFIGPGLFLRGSSSRLWLLTSQPWFWWLRWVFEPSTATINQSGLVVQPKRDRWLLALWNMDSNYQHHQQPILALSPNKDGYFTPLWYTHSVSFGWPLLLKKAGFDSGLLFGLPHTW